MNKHYLDPESILISSKGILIVIEDLEIPITALFSNSEGLYTFYPYPQESYRCARCRKFAYSIPCEYCDSLQTKKFRLVESHL